ncbi:unnamed protein product [Closterium sp. Yama58-4]|nr:unnamed protein product [Closterium sp. Yama58-4]
MIAFLRSHTWTRAFLRSPELHGEAKSLQPLRPSGTRFGTQYIAVSREISQQLTKMVTHTDWPEKGRKLQTCATFEKAVMDVEWWKKVSTFVKVMELPYKVMRKTDGPAKGMMGAVYDMMLQLTVDLTELLERADCQLSEADKQGLLEHSRRHWDESMACPLHVVGRILNPVNQEEGIYLKDRECTSVRKAWLQRARVFVDKLWKKEGEREGTMLDLQEGMLAYIEGSGGFRSEEAIEKACAVEGREGGHGGVVEVEWLGVPRTGGPCATCGATGRFRLSMRAWMGCVGGGAHGAQEQTGVGEGARPGIRGAQLEGCARPPPGCSWRSRAKWGSQEGGGGGG